MFMVKLKVLAALFCVTVAFSFIIKDLSQGARYPGGRSAMEKYFADSVRYPAAELSAGNEEMIYVTFDVSEKGVAQNPRMTYLFGESHGFDAEVNRLLADMPLWEPALDKRGKPVIETYNSALIRFILPDSLMEKFPLVQDTAVLTSAEVMPAFRGNESALQTYLRWMVRYPQMEKEQGKDGTVYIYFEVAPSGKIENVKCQKGVPGAPGLAKEGIRVISAMPRWKPGMQGGKEVRVGMTIPIRFILQ